MTTPVAERQVAETNLSKQAGRGAMLSRLMGLQEFRPAYWAVVPLLAIAAYAAVLRIGFLADDFALINRARDTQFGLQDLLPSGGWYFYRPVGWVLTWVLGGSLWGTNPLPYHALGLALHAIAALALGLWLAGVTSRRWVGLLAGSLFSVFPLHTEAVGWLAAQWDQWAAMFGLLGLWLYSRWWREGTRSFYVLSLLSYFLGVFSKESLFTWLPVFALSAWAMTPRFGLAALRRVMLSLLPFLAVLLLNVGLRLVAWGNLGGYPDATPFSQGHYLDNLVVFMQMLLAPLSSDVFGSTVQQVVGLAVLALLFIGLVWYGRAAGRVLVLAGAWIVLALAPVLNLGGQTSDLQGNRFTYLAAAGYAVMLAVLLWQLILNAERFRQPVFALVGALLIACVAVSWLQLRPWHTATVQMGELADELARVVPPQRAYSPSAWYVQDPPQNYKGAYLLRQSIGEMRRLSGADYPEIKQVNDVSKVDLTSDTEDAFALAFFYSRGAERYHISDAAGITQDARPPSSEQLGDKASDWDFSSCTPSVLSQWQIKGGSARCVPGQGLVFTQAGQDVQLTGPPLQIDPQQQAARFVRFRAAVSYPNSPPSQTMCQWFWAKEGEGWTEGQSASTHVKTDGKPYVYWTYVPASDVQGAINRLRFDPSNASIAPTIRWLAVDLVK